MPPGLHAQDTPLVFPTGFVLFLAYFSMHLINLRRAHALNDVTTFSKSFAESFLNFVLTLDTNIKWNTADITPTWKLWNGTNEMLFNVTEAGVPDIHSVTTSSALLKRCE